MKKSNIENLVLYLILLLGSTVPMAGIDKAQAQGAEAECEGWKDRMQVYTEGDKALYPCSSADDADMPRCKGIYDEAAALMAEFKQTPWATEPCGALHSTLSDLNRYMDNFKTAYDSYAEKQATAEANRGTIVFSRSPIDPDNPSNLTGQFEAGDHIYGLIRTTRPWSVIYNKESDAEVMVNVKLDGEKIHAQFVKLKKSELMGRQYLVFEVAPDPDKMTAYSDPDREYGFSTATTRQGPNELTYHLGQLGPGQHQMEFDVTYFGTVWSAGGFTIAGDDFKGYADLHKQIAESVAQAVTLPAARMTNKSLETEMQALLKNAGWENIHRLNIVDKDWWIDRISGGDSPVKSRHIAAAALAKDGDGYYYKVCTFYQDKLLTGGFGALYLSHQGDRVPVPEANIDKVDGGGGSSAQGDGTSVHVGVTGILLRLILGLTLLFAGFIAAAPMINEKAIIREKAKWLPVIGDRLTPYRMQIGVTVLIVGIVCFLKTLFINFAPLADLFPQLTAVLIGVVMSKELLLRETAPAQGAGVDTESASQGSANLARQVRDQLNKATGLSKGILVSQQDRITWLEKNLISLGLLGLAVGLIHILLGGMLLL